MNLFELARLACWLAWTSYGCRLLFVPMANGRRPWWYR
jgi:hypothetical protein